MCDLYQQDEELGVIRLCKYISEPLLIIFWGFDV